MFKLVIGNRNYSSWSLRPWLAAKQAGVPDIIYRRGIAVPVRDRFLNRLLFRHVVTKLIVNSLETKRCVLGENPGSKAEKARSLGVKILNEAELRKLAGE